MRTKSRQGRTKHRLGRTKACNMRTKPCRGRTKHCTLGTSSQSAVDSRQQAVGREEKKQKKSEVGENLLSESGWIGSISGSMKAVPIRPTVRLGTKAKKAIRIQPVSILILIFHSSLITQPSALPIICKNVAVLEQVPGAWFLVPGFWFQVVPGRYPNLPYDRNIRRARLDSCPPACMPTPIVITPTDYCLLFIGRLAPVGIPGYT